MSLITEYLTNIVAKGFIVGKNLISDPVKNHPNSDVETLIHTMMVYGGEAFMK